MVLPRSLVLLALGLVPAVSMAQVSANFGMVSDYIYRGIFQSSSSASAGLDYEHESGFYIGTWGADVGQGIETDLYFGIGGSAGDLGWGVGYTGYYYTDDWDDTYEEFNLGVSFGGLSLDVAVGGSTAIRNIPSHRSATGSRAAPTSRSAVSARTSTAVTGNSATASISWASTCPWRWWPAAI